MFLHNAYQGSALHVAGPQALIWRKYRQAPGVGLIGGATLYIERPPGRGPSSIG